VAFLSGYEKVNAHAAIRPTLKSAPTSVRHLTEDSIGNEMGHIWGMRHDDICLYFGPVDSAELEALISNRDTARKLVWRAEIILATADGHGTFEIMRRAGTPNPRSGVRSSGISMRAWLVSSVTRRAPRECRLCPWKQG